MAVSIVIGGQYGSEGKGKVAYYWAKKVNAAAVVRVGGCNSGHTVYSENNNRYAFRMLPTSCILENIVSILPAGAYIDISVLLEEIKIAGISCDNLKIDPNAVIIRNEHKIEEMTLGLKEKIGSTLSGTGAAVMERIKRDKSSVVLMAKDVEELKPYITDTKTYLRKLICEGRHIVIEGTQGYGLSNYHAKAYPYATSRDTTAAAFLAETGLSPLDVKHIIMVIRTYPIRVAGDSGPLKNEIDWKKVTEESGATEYLEERTTVTCKVRRVAKFDSEIVRDAIVANRPDVIVLNHLDYLDYANKNNEQLSDYQKSFVHMVEEEINQKINYYGNGEMNLILSESDEFFYERRYK